MVNLEPLKLDLEKCLLKVQVFISRPGPSCLGDDMGGNQIPPDFCAPSVTSAKMRYCGYHCSLLEQHAKLTTVRGVIIDCHVRAARFRGEKPVVAVPVSRVSEVTTPSPRNYGPQPTWRQALRLNDESEHLEIVKDNSTIIKISMLIRKKSCFILENERKQTQYPQNDLSAGHLCMLSVRCNL